MTEHNQYILPPNHVLVKPDVDMTHDRTGLVRHDFVDAHLGKAVTGQVIAVCDNLFFLSNTPDADPDLVQDSLEFDTDMEVRPGDRVLFRYHATIDEDKQVDGMYLMRYDDLFARIETGWLYPLNGMLFLRVGADERRVSGLLADPAYHGASQVRGRVVSEGRLLRGYRDSPDLGPDFAGSLVGKEVVYAKNRAVRIEADDFAQFLHGEYSLYRLHRRYVRLIMGDAARSF